MLHMHVVARVRPTLCGFVDMWWPHRQGFPWCPCELRATDNIWVVVAVNDLLRERKPTIMVRAGTLHNRTRVEKWRLHVVGGKM
jgi:hypothetical protein